MRFNQAQIAADTVAAIARNTSGPLTAKSIAAIVAPKHHDVPLPLLRIVAAMALAMCFDVGIFDPNVVVLYADDQQDVAAAALQFLADFCGEKAERVRTAIQ